MAINLSEKPNVYLLDSPQTGWSVFPDELDTVKIYGNIHVKWTYERMPMLKTPKVQVHMSVDSGVSWKQANGWVGLYYCVFHRHPYSKFYKLDIPVILEDRAKFIHEHTVAKRKSEREAFKNLAPELQEKELVARAAEKARHTSRLENRKGVAAKVCMEHVLVLGPELVKLRDNIDECIKLMSLGGLNKEFPFYLRTIRDVRLANNTIQKRVYEHIKRCQKNKSKRVK